MAPCVLNKQGGLGSSFSDGFMLSYPYTGPCFPIKPVKLLLLLLSGLELIFPSASKSVHGLVRVFVYLQSTHFCMGRYLEGSEDSPHPSLTEREMESGTMWKRDGGRHRKRRLKRAEDKAEEHCSAASSPVA
ncbi:hypothetical protein WMY93_023631 [Mugilogobius chulae]|uniref:Uncharacterized protein n=1 Tax=Mugilogobius chulae TaxID=88201 RepID=A0AAW0NFC1_9GOBI